MGRKGVSKRKSPKSKGPSGSSMSTNSSVSNLVHASESPTPQTLGKGEAVSIGKSGKKKESDSSAFNKKR
jgi:hypothetical protein